MSLSKRQLIIVAIVVALLVAAVLFALNCPPSGIAFTSERRRLQLLKNREVLPSPADFDPGISLAQLLEPGDDRSRWSVSRAARVEGYVVSLAHAKPELANCYCGRDVHIHIALRPAAPPREHFVVELTPRLEATGDISSVGQMQKQLIGRWVRFEGWLFFDAQHAEESENIAPGHRGNWRATSWEIHPATKVEIAR